MEIGGSAAEEVLDALARAAEQAGDDAPLAPTLNAARARQQLTPLQRSVRDWLLALELPLDLAADVEQLTLQAFDEGETYRGGGDWLLRGGAAQLVDRVGSGVVVRRDSPVRRIARTPGAVVVTLEGGEELRADGCVLAVPLAILKAGGIELAPALPPAMARAVDHLGVGLLDKVIVRYSEQAWPVGAQLGVVGTTIGTSIVAVDLHAVTDEPVVAAFVGARHARALERLGEDGMIAAVTAQLAGGFGAQAREPEGALATRWASDPWARGSYSYLARGATADDRRALGQAAGRLVLAGEHTSVDRPATMDGALRSGQRAARTLLTALA